MKLTQIFGFVVLFHLGVVAVLLVQPGCQTSPQRTPVPADTVTSRSTTRMTSTSRPTRPDTETPAPARPSGQVDSAFNSGVTGSRSQPVRPSSASTRETGISTTAPGSEGRLRPVVDLDAGSDWDSGSAGSDYSVQRGDTLSGIARREGISLNELLEANDLSKSATIYVGQVLKIPGSGRSATTGGHPTSTSTSTPTSASGEIYTVRAGDNLTRIANRYGVSVSELRRLNNLTSDTIRVGQALQVPQASGGGTTVRSSAASTAPTAPAASRDGQRYTVKRGDTPITIARSFGVEPNALMGANNISDPRRLFVGQELVIPGSGTPSASTPQQPSSASRPPAAPPAPRNTEAVAPTPLRQQPSTPAIIGQEAPRRLTLDDLESMDDEDLRFVEVEGVNGSGDAGSSDEAQD